ncbi:signal transduction histidine kinase [Streptacidiphilus sp. BW17]
MLECLPLRVDPRMHDKAAPAERLSRVSQNEAAPGAGSAPQVRPAGRLSLSNRRLSFKLVTILLIPVLAALTFAGLRVQSSYTTWRAAQDAVKTAQIVEAATEVAQDLDEERDSSLPYLIKGDDKNPVVVNARATSDSAIAYFQGLAANAPNVGHLQERVKTANDELKGLAQLRAGRYQAYDTATEEGYSHLLSALQALDNELVVGNGSSINSDARSIYAITLTKDAISVDRAIGLHMLLEPTPSSSKDVAGRQNQMIHLWSFLFLEQVAENEFDNAADPQFKQLLAQDEAQAAQQAKAMAAQAAQQAAQSHQSYVPPPADIQTMVNYISSGSLDNHELAAKGVTVQNWDAVMTLSFNAFRGVEKQLTSTSVEQATAAAGQAKSDMIINGAAALAALILASIVTTLVSRSMTRNMRRLRDSAQTIASERLPELVRQLSKTDPGRVDLSVEPIPVSGKDEIAEVARAFDDVHREAIRLAAEQALLRGNVNAIFTNLSRRSHGLIERQLDLITDLENNEADPDQLENLFKLDHLATRMRRNGENLLVLAGEDAGRTWGEPIPLVDVLRAAASEVEQYERIELAGIPETDVVGPAVTDLVHLLAELLENATTFSSPQTRVRVTATRLPDQRVLVEIHDKGIGLTADDFAEINAKLAEPPTVDASVSRQMGLFVVGRLAERHSIRVQLRPSGESAGTTSLVMLTEALTQVARPVLQPEEQFTVSRIYPESPQDRQHAAFGAPDGNPMRTASDLGFDDSRYNRAAPAAEQPAEQTLALDPVQRSLRLGHRREQAALESGPETGIAPSSASVPPAAPTPAPAPQGFPGQGQGGQGFNGQPGQPAQPGQGFGDQGYQQTQEFAAPGYSGGYPQNNGYQQEYGGSEYGNEFGADQRDDYGRDFDARFGSASGSGSGSNFGGGNDFGAAARGQSDFGGNAFGGSDFGGSDFGGDRSGGPSYPTPDSGFEAGRYTAQSFESGAAERRPYGADSADDSYLTPGSTPGMQHYGASGSAGADANAGFGTGRGDRGFEPEPMHGAGGLDLPGSAGLPVRRPGAALGGPTSSQGGDERPNWFTGAKVSGQSTASMPVMPSAHPTGSTVSAGDRGETPALPATPTPGLPTRETRTGGTTGAGLPRRVPRQNLLPGQIQDPAGAGAQETPQPPSQLSRSPEEVRGRLTNLRRGIQQGHNAGDTPQPGSGPYGTNSQER